VRNSNPSPPEVPSAMRISYAMARIYVSLVDFPRTNW